jgi:putative ubiquitin-RnfH superfamily antitoxin RatB of RatAB toxin-antitoxin module
MADLGVTVVYCPDESSISIALRLPAGSTVADAIACSRLLAQRTELELNSLRVGIFGERAELSSALHDGDRVEIYRPLRVDPKEARRQKAVLRRRVAGG